MGPVLRLIDILWVTMSAASVTLDGVALTTPDFLLVDDGREHAVQVVY